MLACFHSARQVSPIMSILALSHPTKRSPIFLYALHLIELTGRASNLLAATSTCTTPTNRHTTSAAAAHPFLSFSDVTPPGISVHPLAAASPYATMHEDVCRIAEEKHAALILLPFHKHITVDGDLEPDANPGHRLLNINVLAHAPCSVAILVDRGLPAAASRQSHRVALLFFGGPHDREALSFAWRMADHPLTSLTLLRFLPIADPRVLTVLTDAVGSMAGVEEEERTADEECLSEFRRKYAGNERVVYAERAVANGADMVAALRGIESVFDLYVVGKCQGGATSVLTAGMTEWTECPELGPIGDLLASSDVAATVSVLVLQQYVGGPSGQAAGLPESPAWGPTRKGNFEIGWGGR
ncbi:hypothetical protein HPP92_015447 [Vanilla planifolia]|uniref:Cation/H(+) antiporter 15 n=1 Tax=Vanilla planifolia TaxID=51239 RepID=A0A835UV43_VANPL|nr:hypothetical protein HPP92_015447 [Vanilla planifolia]